MKSGTRWRVTLRAQVFVEADVIVDADTEEEAMKAGEAYYEQWGNASPWQHDQIDNAYAIGAKPIEE